MFGNNKRKMVEVLEKVDEIKPPNPPATYCEYCGKRMVLSAFHEVSNDSQAPRFNPKTGKDNGEHYRLIADLICPNGHMKFKRVFYSTWDRKWWRGKRLSEGDPFSAIPL